MIVWAYWEGPMPGWIGDCIHSFRSRCRNSEFRLLTSETAPVFVPGLNPRWLTLHPGVGTDCLRAHLLAEHGGLWVDIDSVCLLDPEVLVKHGDRAEQFLYSRWSDGRVIAGYVYSPKGHPVSLRWRDGVDSALKHSHSVGWGWLGEKLLSVCVAGADDRNCVELPRTTFLPVDIDQSVQTLFGEKDWQGQVTDQTVLFGLNHSWMMANKKAEMEVLPSRPRLLIHKLLRHARGMS